VEVVDRAGDPEWIDRFLMLEESGWKGRNGTAMLSRAGHAAFFREVAASLRGAGRLQLMSLECAGSVLAIQCNVRAGDALFWFKTAYEESLARFSPGSHLAIQVAERFLEADQAELMDSCSAPDNELLNGLLPDRRLIRTVVFPGKRMVPASVVRDLATFRTRMAARRARRP
jgi:hypothetical protein